MRKVLAVCTAMGVAVLGVAACEDGDPSVRAPKPAAERPQIRPAVDFDGDGYGDVALGAADGTVLGRARAGGVVVLYGSARGPGRRTVVSRATPGVPGPVREDESFGEAVAVGDLDQDGRSDLVVVADSRRGPVVLWGAAGGPAGGTELAGLGARNVFAVTVGDFDGDGHADIAALGSTSAAGGGHSTVTVLHGPIRRSGAAGRIRALDLRTDPRDYLVARAAAAADLVGDSRDELVVAGYRRYRPDDDGSAPGTWVVREDRRGLHRLARFEDGTTPAVGDIDRDGHADLVLGDPEADGNQGRITVRYGGTAGFRTGVTRITQRTAGVPGPGPGTDQARFGSAVSVRDVDGDGYADVAVGVPGDGGTGVVHTGLVLLFRGTARGLSTRGVRELQGGVDGAPTVEGEEDGFGAGVLLTDMTGDGRAELVAAASGLDDGHGGLRVYRATPQGFPSAGFRTFGRRDLRGLPAADAFGLGLVMAG